MMHEGVFHNGGLSGRKSSCRIDYPFQCVSKMGKRRDCIMSGTVYLLLLRDKWPLCSPQGKQSLQTSKITLIHLSKCHKQMEILDDIIFSSSTCQNKF